MKVTIDIPEQDLKSLEEYANCFQNNGAETIFGKKVTRNELIRLACYLAAHGWERPGSWEGAPMAELIEKHMEYKPLKY